MTEKTATIAIVAMLALVAAGCGDNGESLSLNATPTPAVATPTPAEEAGPELHFGATGSGSGMLALASDDIPIVEMFPTCLGGTGASCTGGSIVYMGTDPGFPSITADDLQQPLYRIADGTEVHLLVTAIDPNVSLTFNDTPLNAVGQSLVLGTTPLHADGSWQFVIAGGTTATPHMVTLQLTTPSSAYTASAPFALALTPSAGTP